MAHKHVFFFFSWQIPLLEQALAACLCSTEWSPLKVVVGYQHPLRSPAQHSPQCVQNWDCWHAWNRIYRFSDLNLSPSFGYLQCRKLAHTLSSYCWTQIIFFQCFTQVTNSVWFGPKHAAVPWIKHKKAVPAIHLLYKEIPMNCSQNWVKIDTWWLMFLGNFYQG